MGWEVEAEGFGAWGAEQEHRGRAGGSWVSLLWVTLPSVLCCLL